MFRWLSLSLLMLVLAACATGGGTVEQVDATTPRQLADEGDFRGAAAAYEELAKRNRRQRDALLLSAAEALREEGDWDAVDATVARVKRRNLMPQQAHRADLLLAEVALARNDATRALTLAVLPDDEDDDGLRIRAAEVRARALAANGQFIESAMERIHLNAMLPAGERTTNENELLETLAGADVKQLAGVIGGLAPADPLRPWLERAMRLKGAVAPRVMPRPTRQAGTLMPDENAAYSREGYATTTRVALLLPLSGPLAAAGAAVRDGFMAAYFADKDARPGVRVLDAGATVETALAAYRAAVADGSVRVIGPLARDQVAAVQSSTELTVPLLALNHPEDGTAPPVGSQQFGLLPDDEAALAAEYAVTRNLRRAAVLTGTEEWSERAALAFRAQIEQLGGQVTGESRLPTEGVDYSGAIAQALGGGADFVFLAVRPAQGRLVVPQLRARGSGMPILATSHIYSGLVNRPLDRDLNGVEFCDAPWLFGLATGLPSRDALARRLQTAAANPRLFAFGMDAYRLLPYLDWLAQNHDAYLPGASGQLAIDEFGRVRRLLTWMRFVDGVPRSADGALSPEESVPPP